MALHRDEALVLRRLDYSETSQILLVFCRELGAQRLIAKGIKRGTKTRVAVGVDLLEAGTVVLSRRTGADAQLGIMTEWRQQDTFPHLRRDLPRLYAAQYAAEATGQLTESGDPHPGLFDALRSLFTNLAAGEPLGHLVAFLLTLLREIGLMPQFNACVACGRTFSPLREAGGRAEGGPGRVDLAHLYFSSHQGGIICRDCEPAAVEKRRVDPVAVSILQERAEGSARDSRVDSAAFDLLDYHLTETIGRPLRLSQPLRDALCRAAAAR